MMSADAREDYLIVRVRAADPFTRSEQANDERLWANDLALERAFVAAGGLLMAGPDPTGNGGVTARLRRPARD